MHSNKFAHNPVFLYHYVLMKNKVDEKLIFFSFIHHAIKQLSVILKALSSSLTNL